MRLTPANLQELTETLTHRFARGETVDAINLRAFDRVVEHSPEDMTVTVEAGITLADLQARLGKAGQWIPIDPSNPASLTVGALLATDASGPRRFGCGTIRDHLLGIKVVLADGRMIKSGGKVVKNVAGYDLGKLFIGSHGSLGVIVEGTFKLRPLPEVEAVVQAHCDSLDQAGALIETILQSEVTPVVLDLHNLETLTVHCSIVLVVGFAGTREEVDWQLAQVRELGVRDPSSLDYEKVFWSEDSSVRPRRLSVLPTHLVAEIRALGDCRFVARAGNGVIYHWGGPKPTRADLPVKLMRRLKDEFDPKHIFPEVPL
jgi:FAD/FMN-containing dehydrogenase